MRSRARPAAASAGRPWEGAQGWIPTMQIHAGSGAPHGGAPSLQSTRWAAIEPDFSKLASGIVGFGKGLQGLDWGGAYGRHGQSCPAIPGAAAVFWKGDAYGGSARRRSPGYRLRTTALPLAAG
jgi:hypothetical protein